MYIEVILISRQQASWGRDADDNCYAKRWTMGIRNTYIVWGVMRNERCTSNRYNVYKNQFTVCDRHQTENMKTMNALSCRNFWLVSFEVTRLTTVLECTIIEIPRSARIYYNMFIRKQENALLVCSSCKLVMLHDSIIHTLLQWFCMLVTEVEYDR